MFFTISGQKGGAGKSTVAVCLASELLERGRRVLLVDADPQGTVATWAAVAAEAGRACPTVISMGATMHRPDQLPRVATAFEDVVIDCPPRHDAVQRAALMVADIAILPVGPSPADAWALAKSAELVVEAQTVRPTLRPLVLLTRIQASTGLSRAARSVVTGAGLPVLRTTLGYRVAYAEALAAGVGVTGRSSSDRAALEVRGLVDELEAAAGRKREVAHVA